MSDVFILFTPFVLFKLLSIFSFSSRAASSLSRIGAICVAELPAMNTHAASVRRVHWLRSSVSSALQPRTRHATPASLTSLQPHSTSTRNEGHARDTAHSATSVTRSQQLRSRRWSHWANVQRIRRERCTTAESHRSMLLTKDRDDTWKGTSSLLLTGQQLRLSEILRQLLHRM